MNKVLSVAAPSWSSLKGGQKRKKKNQPKPYLNAVIKVVYLTETFMQIYYFASKRWDKISVKEDLETPI